MVNIAVFSKGKINRRNEDFFSYNKSTFVVVDGVPDKGGKKYLGKTSGEIVSKLVGEKCLSSSKTGSPLVKELNEEVRKLHKRIHPSDLKEYPSRFSCVFVCARIKKQNLVITQIIDVSFRINSKKVYTSPLLFDSLISNLRAEYIEKTGDIKNSGSFILPLLGKIFQYHNNTDSPLGIGVINGTSTPTKFIRVFKFKLKDIHTLEIFTDGYPDVPKGSSIKSWESMYKQIEKKDPYKYRIYKSTKPKDDRTIMIVKFK